MYRIFYRIALVLYKRACIHKISFPSGRQVEKDLECLHPGENQKQICMEYYVNKLAKSLMICAIAMVLGLVLAIQAKGSKVLNSSGEIVRGNYEEEAQTLEMECVLPDGEQEFTVEVGARTYDEETIRRLYEEFSALLGQQILGENPSLAEVTEDLHLCDYYEGYPFVVEWESSNPDAVSSSGKVKRGEALAEGTLTAIVSYGEWEWKDELVVQVQPVSLSEQECLRQELEALLESSELNSRTEAIWKLPESWQGQKLKWRIKTGNRSIWVLVGGVVVALLVYLMADKDLHDSVEKRKQKMKRDYSDVVHKLTLYLGAGMTIRGSFQKMAEEYDAARKEGKKEVPIYEEVIHICRELKAGVSEGAAYEHLGRRTGLQEYIRLCTLLTQNLKKGNSTLLQRLREETEKASIERIQYSKRLGEEAVTKLLLPMVLMLLVVMLMIMIPAFSSMGI